ncbi:VOC family protein [Myxococcota bacterium]|nr:VOC family protein [Myxococcota bacterium]
MSNPSPPAVGTIGWLDLTIPDAEAGREFYAAVCGWTAAPIDMGGYNDYTMTAPGGQVVAGVCHARGPNADLPPQWLPYVTVSDVAASVAAAAARGGRVLRPVQSLGSWGQLAVIQDPAGATLALIQPPDAPA